MDHLSALRQQLVPLQTALRDHAIYQHLGTLPALRRFLEHHVYAVWDFMSLLKALQRRLCCIDVPWVPSGHPLGCRLVNEIVLGEESDADEHGNYLSHFELYRQAMVGCGADVASIDGFVADLRGGTSVAAALEAPWIPAIVRPFVRQTFAVIESGQVWSIAAAFTFGREDLLPTLFRRVVDGLDEQTSGGVAVFRYYLHRHIGLDETEHGPLAGKLLEMLCGDDAQRWAQARRTAVQALEARQALWDGMLATVSNLSGKN